jgi:uncharacterized RDD family membrane protein YckC
MENLPYASWGSRFWAWLIDIILVGIIWQMIAGTFIFMGNLGNVHVVGAGSDALLMFIYWTVLDGYRGQSIGKMALNLEVTDTNGQKIGYADAAIESFGKAFLLPLDCIIGWLAMPGSGQRLFNRISSTVVVRSGPECCRR